MLISCPKCSTSFALPVKAIGEKGRKLKCSKCGNVWFQKPSGFDRNKLDEFLEVTPPNENDDKNLPVKIKRKINLLVPFVILSIVALAVYIGNYKNPAYSGLSSYNLVEFQEFYASSEIQDNRLVLDISGKVINNSDQKIEFPEIVIYVLSRGGNYLKEEEYISEKQFLEPNEASEINIKLDRISGNADRIKISSNHWLENMFLSNK